MARAALKTLLLITALLLGGAPPAFAGPAGSPRLGLWIECEGAHHTLDDAERIAAAVDAAGALGATDLFVQVYRNGTAWFPTRLASDAPYARARARGVDPLGMTLRLAHARGLRVHAWVNVLRVDSGERSALVRALGPEAVLGDETGRPLTAPGPWGSSQNVKPDTPGAWLDPGSPAVAERLSGILGDLLKAYPALDGLHLDYLRYPMPISAGSKSRAEVRELGWTAASRAAFLAATRKAGVEPSRPRWDAWRRDRLTALLRRLRDVLSSDQRERVLSAAVIPAPREAIDRALQDWPAWGRDGLLDVIVPMNYTADPLAFDALARTDVARRGRAAMLIGVGAWRFADDVAAIALRVHLAREAGAQGAVLFSHDNLRSETGAFDRLGALLRAELRTPATSIRPATTDEALPAP
ncbi:MAG: family 10 glycosylhydrolase [Deltaproteobacteria bacterium]|nr:family 10 glycosylhydrolase [Deltaproteobacteria bacterium]